MTSKNEDEYFARRDAELKQHLHARQVAETESAERRTHLMRCPRCGGHLHHVVSHNITIDKCPDCRGIFLDDGELESLGGHETTGLLGRVFGDFRKAFHNKTDAK